MIGVEPPTLDLERAGAALAAAAVALGAGHLLSLMWGPLAGLAAVVLLGLTAWLRGPWVSAGVALAALLLGAALRRRAGEAPAGGTDAGGAELNPTRHQRQAERDARAETRWRQAFDRAWGAVKGPSRRD